MPAKKTQAEFIADARKVHGDKYDYSLVEYKNSSTKVKIICSTHGVFEQAPVNHCHQKQGCFTCSGNSSYTTEEFVQKAKEIHGSKYDYSQVVCNGNKKKVVITCPKHGVFQQAPHNHIYQKQGCQKCYDERRGASMLLDTATFIERAISIHGDKYDYSLVNYKNALTVVDIKCPKHGVFKQRPTNHVRLKQGCAACAGRAAITTKDYIKRAKAIHGDKFDYSLTEYINGGTKVKIICKVHGVFEQVAGAHINNRNGCAICANKGLSTTEAFIKKAKRIHGDRFDYSLVDYKHNKAEVSIICKKHGVFQQMPNGHLDGDGCSKCSASKGEIRINRFLKEAGFVFEAQKRFKKCRNKKTLPFDFFLPSHNLLIEYDGRQHFKPFVKFGGEDAVKTTQKNDAIKTAFAAEHGFNLLRIKYTDFDRIEEILAQHLSGTQLALFGKAA